MNDDSVWPIALRTNDQSRLVATAFDRPSLSWRLEARRDAVQQCAYELQRAPDAGFSSCLSSGRVKTASVVGAAWIGAPLESREVAFLRVRVWTDRGATRWSEVLRVEGGLFRASDWTATAISPISNAGQVMARPAALLRRSFVPDQAVTRAMLYVSALGIHDCRINGSPISPDLFDPGWTSYQHRLLYSAYDVTPLLRAGENEMLATVGDGWWRGNLTWMGKRAVYGDTTALIAQLELQLADGTTQRIVTDDSWQGSTGPLIIADIYDGCTTDLRPIPGRWEPVITLPIPARIVQRSAPPVRIVKTIDVTAKAEEDGLYSIDCGQNLVGYLQLSVSAESEASITVRHAEILGPGGRLLTAPLRDAKAIDIYHVPAGDHVLSPKFTFHGFRYAEIQVAGNARISDVKACVLSSDLPEIGHFACSNAKLNRLYDNIKWSQRGNFLSIPTDCPQRDERLGWTGDIQVFGQTACANFDSSAFLESWLVDLAHEQAADGQVTSTVPNVIQGHDYEYAGIGWADAAVLLPWAVYEAYGDPAILRRTLPSMCRWVDYCASRLNADAVWVGDFHLGDWLDPGAPPDKPEQATTDRDFLASAYLAKSAATLAKVANVLDEAEQAARYDALSKTVAAATWAKWSDATMHTQTGCALLIEFGIAPIEAMHSVGEAFAALVQQSGGCIATGFLGTPLALPALTRTGQHDAAFRLLLNEDMPGWLYQINQGATTLWERWDAILPDGIAHDGAMAAADASSMTSFNHYAYGAVGAWMMRTLAGIAPHEDSPGYLSIDFSPQVGGDVTWAEASIQTPYGQASIHWKVADGVLSVALEIPPGATGQFFCPVGWYNPRPEKQIHLSSGNHSIKLVKKRNP